MCLKNLKTDIPNCHNHPKYSWRTACSAYLNTDRLDKCLTANHMPVSLCWCWIFSFYWSGNGAHLWWWSSWHAFCIVSVPPFSKNPPSVKCWTMQVFWDCPIRILQENDNNTICIPEDSLVIGFKCAKFVVRWFQAETSHNCCIYIVYCNTVLNRDLPWQKQVL